MAKVGVENTAYETDYEAPNKTGTNPFFSSSSDEDLETKTKQEPPRYYATVVLCVLLFTACYQNNVCFFD